MIERTLDNIHTYITGNRLLQLFTACTRVLLALGFIPPSYTKIMGRPFTVLPLSNPVGYYFDALFRTGFYYEFLGWGQMIAAILLLIPRTSHIGALIFLPIILNIAVLTASVGFKGTWVITIFMTLAATWLVTWDYDRLKPVLFQKRAVPVKAIPWWFISIPVFFAIGGFAFANLTWFAGIGAVKNYIWFLGILTALGLVFGIAVSVHWKFMRVGQLEKSGEPL
jgi:hypothetical protein